MKKILIIDPANFVGGAELFTIDLLHHLDPKQYEVHVLTNKHEAYLKQLEKTKASIHEFLIPRMKSFSFHAIRHFFSVVRIIQNIIVQHEIDIVQSNSIRAHILATIACIGRKFNGRTVKLLWMLHDITFPRFFLKILIWKPQKIVVASEYVKNYYRRLIPKRYREKFTIIPNGIDVQKIQTMHFTADLRKELNLGHEVRFVGMVGRIDWWKGHDFFIRAASKVVAKIPKTKFLIIGASSTHDPKTMEFERDLKELANDLHLNRDVFFLGFRPNVFEIMRELDVLVHASIIEEPFGRVVLEGMAVGTPVIASPLGGPCEIIENGVNGLLVDPRETEQLAKAICRILEQEKLREKLVSNAFKTLQKHYDIWKVVHRIEKLYES
ncbi:glycosyltransferase family 4 protein [Candidatus Peregrinibacteria bacterium]|nr:glycosyltransferase family 4 protein [Candidatus Peregrinibacteria bacterium]